VLEHLEKPRLFIQLTAVGGGFVFCDPSRIYAVQDYLNESHERTGSLVYSDPHQQTEIEPLAKVTETPEEVLRLMGVSVISSDDRDNVPENANPSE